MTDTYSIKSLEHLGLVAGICDHIGLVGKIDEVVGQKKREISVGVAVKAMILNAMGFVGQPLYEPIPIIEICYIFHLTL